MSLGWNEILLILLIVLLLFGGRKIPELMRGLGKGIREFNDAKDNVKKEIEEGLSEKERKAATSTPTPTPSNSNTSSTATPQQ
ncbi:MAG TPA: twin-arginine translocase TatA/TatE family subunit [Chitinophagaceae bacterium]|jgi:twin arginine-targeting protein translocase, TatA/E family